MLAVLGAPCCVGTSVRVRVPPASSHGLLPCLCVQISLFLSRHQAHCTLTLTPERPYFQTTQSRCRGLGLQHIFWADTVQPITPPTTHWKVSGGTRERETEREWPWKESQGQDVREAEMRDRTTRQCGQRVPPPGRLRVGRPDGGTGGRIGTVFQHWKRTQHSPCRGRDSEQELPALGEAPRKLG